ADARNLSGHGLDNSITTFTLTLTFDNALHLDGSILGTLRLGNSMGSPSVDFTPITTGGGLVYTETFSGGNSGPNPNAGFSGANPNTTWNLLMWDTNPL